MNKNTIVWITLVLFTIIHLVIFAVTGDDKHYIVSQSFLVGTFICSLLTKINK